LTRPARDRPSARPSSDRVRYRPPSSLLDNDRESRSKSDRIEAVLPVDRLIELLYPRRE
jgi:hypothetical protein